MISLCSITDHENIHQEIRAEAAHCVFYLTGTILFVAWRMDVLHNIIMFD